MKKITKIKLILTALVAVSVGGLVSFMTSPVNAKEGDVINITVSPYDNLLTMQPGETYKGSFKLGNYDDATAPLEYEVLVQTMSISDQDNKYVANFGAKDVKYSDLTKWITLDSPDTGTLQPLEDTIISYTIHVPENATPGGQYAGITVRQKAGSVSEGHVGVISQNSANYVIYGKIAGQATESGNILENNVSTFFLSKPLSVTSIVENTGNVHADAYYTFRVMPLFGDEEYYTNAEKPDRYIILPGTRRFVSQSWDAESLGLVGIFRAEQTVKFLGETSTTSKIIILCPIWLLLAIVFVIVFWIIWLVMRHKNRKAAAKSKAAGKSSKSPNKTPDTTSSIVDSATPDKTE